MSMTMPDTPTVGPYATAAPTYWAAGWRGLLPLPPHRKHPVPNGWTGARGTWPSRADVQAWVEDHPGSNLALRLPPGVIGIDVDHYDTKPGGLVLDQLEQQLGPLPATWRTTSRDDGVSGIRLYRVPEGLRWPGGLGPGIDTIRVDHRYAVAWPSTHPNGGTYRWITPDGATTLGTVPTPDDLPHLPDAWIAHFTRGELATDQPHADLTDSAATTWLTTRGNGHPCRHTDTALARALTDLTTATSRHDTTLSSSNRLVWLAGEGHTGATTALQQLRAAFLKATAGDRATGDAEAEWDRMVAGAVRIAAAAHPQPSPDPCDDPFHGLIPKETAWSPSPGTAQTGTSTTGSPAASAGPSTGSPATPSAASAATAPACTSTAPAPAATSGSAGPAAPSSASEAPATPEVGDASREVATRLRPGGAFILDIPEHVPAIWGSGEAILWAEGEALTICGPAGVGKTTLTGQILRARLIGGEVLDLPVQPTSSKVLYLAMDRPRQIARALRRTLGDLPRETLDERLVFWAGPPIADVAAHPETLLGLVQLAGADTVIVDSIKDAAVGLSSDEVGAGYNRARQMCIAAGIQVLEQHHMVKKGENGAKPTSLADLYGSVWIGAGSGSVVLLYGQAGDAVVDFRHLKTPAEEVGPYRVTHDHEAGHSSIWHQADALAMAKAAGRRGITAKDVARAVEQKENPGDSAIVKQRRKLDKLVLGGRLNRVEGSTGGASGSTPATYHYVQDAVDELLGSTRQSTEHPPPGDTIGNTAPAPDTNHVSAGQSTRHSTEHTDTSSTGHSTPPLYRGVDGGRAPQSPVVERVIAGERVKVNLDTGETTPA